MYYFVKAVDSEEVEVHELPKKMIENYVQKCAAFIFCAKQPMETCAHSKFDRTNKIPESKVMMPNGTENICCTRSLQTETF